PTPRPACTPAAYPHRDSLRGRSGTRGPRLPRTARGERAPPRPGPVACGTGPSSPRGGPAPPRRLPRTRRRRPAPGRARWKALRPSRFRAGHCRPTAPVRAARPSPCLPLRSAAPRSAQTRFVWNAGWRKEQGGYHLPAPCPDWRLTCAERCATPTSGPLSNDRSKNRGGHPVSRFTEDEIKQKVRDGYILESPDEMTEGYRKSLIVQLLVQADT